MSEYRDFAALTEKVRGRKTTRPGVNGIVELSPFDILDRLADLVPPPRKHGHRYHGVFAPNHKLRPAVTALAIANVGKPRDAATGGHAVGGHAAGGDATADCCDSCDQPRSHDTSRRSRRNSWRGWERSFRSSALGYGGDIRLIALHPSRGRSGRSSRIWANRSSLRQSLPPAARPPTGERSCRSTFDRAIFQASPEELPVIDIHSL